MRTLVVTAANEGFAPLLRGLIESLHQWEPRPFTDLACFDFGLAPASRQWVSRYARFVVEPNWDLPVADKLRQEQPHLRAHTARPFLPRYFPGYEIYLWIDADAWVQERFALQWLIAAAAEGHLAAVPEVDRTYHNSVELVEWRLNRLTAYFGHDAAKKSFWNRYYNSGVFALRGDAPHWSHWAKWLNVGLKATNGTLVTDQTALNQAIWSESLPVNPLPALCNWLCHLAHPYPNFTRGRFCEPAIPVHPIGILHLAADSKDFHFQHTLHGTPRTFDFRFPGLSRLTAEENATKK